MKIVLLTNILSPYRKILFDRLFQVFRDKESEFKVFVMAETEPGRQWLYDEFKGPYSELLTSRTVTFHHICFHFNKNLKKRLKELKPDLVIASGSYISPSVLKSILLRKKLNYLLFFWSESHLEETRSYNRLQMKIRDRIRSLIYKKFDGFWYAGSKSLEFIKKYAGQNRSNDKCKYYFIPNLVEADFFRRASQADDEERIRLRTALWIPLEQFVFILPARLSPEKGILPFIHLYRNCIHRNRAVILILGEGALRNDLEELVRNCQLDIRLLGYKTPEEILRYYSIADCFLLPSISDSNPLSCIEALWAGLPLLLSSHVGNHPEAVRSGQNGYIFNYDAPEEAVRTVDTMISSSKEWRAAAREISLGIAEELFEPEHAVLMLTDSILKDRRQKQM